MDYIQVTFFIEPYEEYISDILISELGEIGFDSFEPFETGVNAYIPSELFSEIALHAMLDDFPFEVSIEYKLMNIQAQNWNEEWEKNYFQPIVIDNECVIHSSFHKDVPFARYDIVIDPKMSFGTGHHETTSQMIAAMLKIDFTGKRVLDMGCGTAVLAILARMRGAVTVTAVDIDSWGTENSEENIRINHVEGIEVLLGGAEQLKDKTFDIILANINRNILLSDMDKYTACLLPEGELFMSGFYTEDVSLIEAQAIFFGFNMLEMTSKNNWAMVRMLKKR